MANSRRTVRDKEFVSQVNEFIEKYGTALKELAKK